MIYLSIRVGADICYRSDVIEEEERRYGQEKAQR